jgi:hypothetical protein
MKENEVIPRGVPSTEKIIFAVMEKYLTSVEYYAIIPEVSRKKA